MCREEILTATSANLTGNKLHRASKEQGGRTSSPDVEAAQRYTVFFVPKKKKMETFSTKKSIILKRGLAFMQFQNFDLQCVTIEFRQGPVYVVNSQFSRCPDRC